MESCAFYSQVFGMVIYLLVVQIMAAIKKANNTPLQLRQLVEGNKNPARGPLSDPDPFWKSVLDDNSASTKDFFATESFSMNTMVILLNNISTLCFAVNLIFPNLLSTYFNIFLVNIAINGITILYYAWIVYNGTSFKKVFSPCN